MTTVYGAGMRNRSPMSGRELANPVPERMLQNIANAEKEIAVPVSGISADGNVIPGLFPIASTGVSTKAIKDAADAFLALLTPGQREGAVFAIDGSEWRRWSNIHPYLMRHGASLEAMSDAQRDAALGVLKATMSASGFQTSRDIMRLNYTIGELTNSWTEYGEWVYWLSIMGTPSLTEPWGWQMDGHHLNVNCFILGDQVVMTPAFFGSEPVHALDGKYAGTRVLEAEEARGMQLLQALSTEQRGRAVIGDASAHPMDGRIKGGAFRDNFVLPYEGLPADDMTSGQRELLMSVVEAYVGRLAQGHAQVRMREVEQHLNDTHFAWMGETSETGVYYYRVHSPVILIEFDHQRGVAFDNEVPFRQHIHTIVRTPNGGDYGTDLLRQHYERHHRPVK